MRPSPDTIPIRLAPIAGEAMDSWLEAYAHRLHSTVSELLALADIPVPGRGAMAGSPWTARRHPEHFAALAAVSGLAVEVLDAMSPAYYEGTLLTISQSHQERGRSRWWPPGNGSRFCPRCLQETGGRWLLEWRLPWVFACLKHSCVLVDACPGCGHRPRRRWFFPRGHSETLGTCRSRIATPEPVQPSPVCGYPLPEFEAATLAADGPTIVACRRLSKLLHDAVAFGPGTDGQPNPFLLILDDIYAVARSALIAHSRSASGAVPDIAGAVLEELGDRVLTGGERTTVGPVRLDAEASGFALAVAIYTLAPGADRPDAEIMSWLARHELRERGHGRPGPVLNRWNRATPPLKAAILSAVGPHLRPTEQLRYLTSTNTPRPPTDGVIARRSSTVPAVFWRGWALRLNPGRFATLSFRETLSTLLMQVGTTDDYRSAHLALGRTLPRASGHSSSWMTSALKQDGALHVVLQALSYLATSLDEYGCPIDYERRRRLFTSPELDVEFLHSHFDAVGLRQPVERELRLYRLRLAELLTGHPPQYAPDNSSPALTPSQVNYYENAVIAKKPEVTDHLEAQALRRLAALGIDEPVQWEPPFSWVPELDWPGPHPAEIDTAAMWRMLRTGNGPGRVAMLLGTSLEHVRAAALHHRDPGTYVGEHRAFKPKIPRNTLPSAEELLLARDRGETLEGIAETTGCSRSVLQKVARDHGITFRIGRGPCFLIDAQWLREQVEGRHRTFRELSEELGVSAQRLGALARDMGVKAHPRGGPGHRHPLAAHGGPQAFSAVLWAAFKGQGAISRVRRFLATEGNSSIRATAESFGVTEPTLHHQLELLERKTGLELFQRRGTRRTLVYSTEGRKFADEARNALKLIDSPAPASTRPGEPYPAIVRLRPTRTTPPQ